jgi:hypothetical protein
MPETNELIRVLRANGLAAVVVDFKGATVISHPVEASA